MCEEKMCEASYLLTPTNNEVFTSRVNSIFGRLNSLEQKHAEAVKDYKVSDDDVQDSCRSNGQNRRSNASSQDNRKRKVPDFVENPSKWKKYSLKEDGTSTNNLSADQVNSKVAMEFMENLKYKKESEANTEECSDSPVFKKESEANTEECFDSPVFKVPDVPNTASNPQTKSSFVSSHAGRTRCMDTYEFGQKTKKHEAVDKCRDSELPIQEIVLNYEHPEDIGTNDESIDMDVKQEETTESKTFISKGKKKLRVIRKRVCDEDE